jgi:hypothetical protein
MGQQRGATLEPRISLDTFLQIFRNFSFFFDRSRCFLNPGSASINVIHSVIQICTTGQLQRLRRRSPPGNGSFRPTAFRFSFSTASLTAAADVKVLGQVDLSKRNHSGAPHLMLTWRYQGTSCRWILLPLAEPVPTKAWS